METIPTGNLPQTTVMKFCQFCGSMLVADTSKSVLKFHCLQCNKFFDSTDADSIRREIDHQAAKSSEKYKTMEENAAFDSCSLKVDYECPECKMPYMSHIYIGEECVSKYICVCGFKTQSKDFNPKVQDPKPPTKDAKKQITSENTSD